MVGVPVAAGAMTAAVLLGPAEERPVVGVKVHGALAGGASLCAFRLQALRHLDGLRRPFALEGLELVVRDAAGSDLCVWQGDADERGIAETRGRMRRAARAGETLRLAVSAGRRVLVDEPFVVAEPAEPQPPPRWSVVGPPALTVTLPRGKVVPELPERLLVTVRGARAPRPDVISETVGGEQGEVVRERLDCRSEDDCQHYFSVTVVARAPVVRLSVTATLQGRQSHWEGDLPIVPGGIWLDPEALARGTLRIRSAILREEVFVSRYDPSGRRWGTTVAMNPDGETGSSHGELDLPAGRGERVEVLRLASEAAEPIEATTSWPLLRMETLEGMPMVRFADSLPAAITAERTRMSKTRLPAFGLILAAGLFEVLYLLRRFRKAGATLDHHVADALDQPRATIRQRTPIAWLTFLSAILVLAFFVLAAVAAWA